MLERLAGIDWLLLFALCGGVWIFATLAKHAEYTVERVVWLGLSLAGVLLLWYFFPASDW